MLSEHKCGQVCGLQGLKIVVLPSWMHRSSQHQLDHDHAPLGAHKESGWLMIMPLWGAHIEFVWLMIMPLWGAHIEFVWLMIMLLWVHTRSLAGS